MANVSQLKIHSTQSIKNVIINVSLTHCKPKTYAHDIFPLLQQKLKCNDAANEQNKM